MSFRALKTCMNSYLSVLNGSGNGRRIFIRLNSIVTQAESMEIETIVNPYFEGENSFVIKHLKTLPAYKNTLFDPEPFMSQEKWNSFKPFVQKLKFEAGNPDNPLTSLCTPDFISSIISEKSSLSDEELMAVMYALQFYKTRPFPKLKSAFKYLWEALDQECLARSTGWDFNKLLTIDDLFYHLRSVNLTGFHWYLIKKLFRKCDKLTKEQFIRFMFCLNVGRRLPKTLTTYELEHKLHKIAGDLSAEEISIVAMGFFKTESRIRDDKLVHKLLEKVIPAAKTLTHYSVAAIAKLVRNCAKYGNSAILYEFQEAFLLELPRLKLAEVMHLALVGTQTQVKHTGLLEAARDLVEANLENARLKEIERILLALTMFNIECTSLCNKVVEQLRRPSPARQKECEEYGRSLPSILHYATIQNIIPQDLISKVLEPKFLKTFYDNNSYKYQREMLCLDMTATIECPDYSGHHLSQKERQSLSKYSMLYLNPTEKEKVSEYESGLRSIARHAKDILGGEEFAYMCNILPQFHSAEILYCMDERNQPVKVPQSIRQIEEFQIKWIPNDDPALKNVTCHLIFNCHRNVCVLGHKLLLGQVLFHCRQLEKLGYKTHLVFGIEWNAYKHDEAKRRKHIYDLIYGIDSA